MLMRYSSLQIGKGMFLYSAVSSPFDRSKVNRTRPPSIASYHAPQCFVCPQIGTYKESHLTLDTTQYTSYDSDGTVASTHRSQCPLGRTCSCTDHPGVDGQARPVTPDTAAQTLDDIEDNFGELWGNNNMHTNNKRSFVQDKPHKLYNLSSRQS